MHARKFLMGLIAVSFAAIQASTAHAAVNYDLKEMTPLIQQAIEGRQSRYNELQKLKSEGKIGENNQGYLKNLSGSSEAETLVERENQDRKIIYDAVVNQNKLGRGALPQVESAFAEVQRDKARPGDFIQLPSGKWVQK